MRFIFSTGSIYLYSVERCWQLAAAAGFDGVELMVDHRWDTRQPAYLASLAARYDLPILAVHSPFSNVPGWPTGQQALLGEAVRLAEAVGAPTVIHHLPVRVGHLAILSGGKRYFVPMPGVNSERAYRRWLEQEYEVLQGSTDVELCIENMPARKALGRRINAHTWNTPAEIARFPRLTMDTTHLGTWDLEPVDVYATWGERVRHVHLSNFDGREHRLPEAGHLRLDHLIAALSAAGYDGSISFELHPDAVGAGEDDDAIVARLAGSLAQARGWAGDARTAARDFVGREPVAA